MAIKQRLGIRKIRCKPPPFFHTFCETLILCRLHLFSPYVLSFFSRGTTEVPRPMSKIPPSKFQKCISGIESVVTYLEKLQQNKYSTPAAVYTTSFHGIVKLCKLLIGRCVSSFLFKPHPPCPLRLSSPHPISFSTAYAPQCPHSTHAAPAHTSPYSPLVFRP